MSDPEITEKLIELMRAARAAVVGGVPPAVLAWVANEPRSNTAPQGRREISESGARAAVAALAVSGQLRAGLAFLREVYSFTAQEAVYILRALDPGQFRAADPRDIAAVERELLDQAEDRPYPFQIGCPLHPTRPDPDNCPRCAECEKSCLSPGGPYPADDPDETDQDQEIPELVPPHQDMTRGAQ